MSIRRDYVGNIRNEVERERVGWLVGGYIRRQLRALVFTLPGFLAILLLKDGTLKTVIVGCSFGAWAVWNALTLGVGTFFISRWADKNYGKHPELSKDYRKH